MSTPLKRFKTCCPLMDRELASNNVYAKFVNISQNVGPVIMATHTCTHSKENIFPLTKSILLASLAHPKQLRSNERGFSTKTHCCLIYYCDKQENRWQGCPLILKDT